MVTVAAPADAGGPTRPVGGEPPTTGVLLDAPSLVGGTDASGIELNPASLGLLDSWAVMLRHAEMMEQSRVNGRGTALMLGTPLPFLRSVALGAGLSWLRPPESIGYEDSVKISLGLAYNFRQMLSLGLSYHTFIADGDAALDGLDAFDVGLAIRPYEWLGAGVVVRNLNTPVYDGLPLQRVYDFELVGRPLATNRLEIGAGLSIGERRGNLDPHFRLAAVPIDGLQVFAGIRLLDRDYYRDNDSTLDVRVTAGLGINLERIGVAFSAILGRGLDQRVATNPGEPMAANEARDTFQGVGVTLRLQGKRNEPLTVIERKIVHLELKGAKTQLQWVKLVATLREIERREDVAGVLLEIDGLGNGWGHTQELRRWLKRLRRAGKKSWAYVRAPGFREYYLAAAADKVLLDPAGTVRVMGLHVRRLYFRGLLDKVGLSAQFIKIAEFKSAPETFTEKTATPAARRMRSAILDDLYGQLLADVSRDRKIKAATFGGLLDQGPFTPPQALKHKLVDQLVPPGEVKQAVKRASGAKLIKPGQLRRRPSRWPVGPAIAVIVVDGDIVRGKSMTIPLLGQRLVGDETIAKALTWARANNTVKAVVLRVNSPGGSAMASDRMWREVRRLRKVKPVVVSIGDIAASGGYYVACAADMVLAEPAAITGSIGIFSGKVNASALLERLGISVDSEKRGKRADMETFQRSYTKEERKVILARLQHFYRAFLSAVGQGRKMTAKQVHELARGRVWTGRQARGRRLVDGHGGLMEAIEFAKRKAGLAADRPTRFVVLPQEEKGLLGRALSILGAAEAQRSSSLSHLIPPGLRDALKGLLPVFFKARAGEPLARMPYTLLID